MFKNVNFPRCWNFLPDLFLPILSGLARLSPLGRLFWGSQKPFRAQGHLFQTWCQTVGNCWCFPMGKSPVDGSEIRLTHQLRLVVENPIIYKVLAPSQVVIAGFLNHQQYHLFSPGLSQRYSTWVRFTCWNVQSVQYPQVFLVGFLWGKANLQICTVFLFPGWEAQVL